MKCFLSRKKESVLLVQRKKIQPLQILETIFNSNYSVNIQLKPIVRIFKKESEYIQISPQFLNHKKLLKKLSLRMNQSTRGQRGRSLGIRFGVTMSPNRLSVVAAIQRPSFAVSGPFRERNRSRRGKISEIQSRLRPKIGF